MSVLRSYYFNNLHSPNRAVPLRLTALPQDAYGHDGYCIQDPGSQVTHNLSAGTRPHSPSSNTITDTPSSPLIVTPNSTRNPARTHLESDAVHKSPPPSLYPKTSTTSSDSITHGPACEPTIKFALISNEDGVGCHSAFLIETLGQADQLYTYHPVYGYQNKYPTQKSKRLHRSVFMVGTLRGDLFRFVKSKLKDCSKAVQKKEPFATAESRSRFWGLQLWRFLAAEAEREKPNDPSIHGVTDEVLRIYFQQFMTPRM